MLPPRMHEILNDFYCPECENNLILIKKNHEFDCENCHTHYSFKNHAPVLLSKQRQQRLNINLSSNTGQQMFAEYENIKAQKSNMTVKEQLIKFITPPKLMLHYNPDLALPITSKLFNHQGTKTKILNVGGGPRRYSDQEIIMNIDSFHQVDLVADARNIPIKDNTFDSVFSIAVLEHIPNPQQAVKEMLRVLKPNGYLYAEIPFIYFFHGYPNDYQRFTKEGIRHLFKDLKAVEIGITEGSVSAVLQSLNMLLNLFLPVRFPIIKKIFNGIFRWLFFPLKYLDKLIAHKKNADILAGGFYIIGKK